MISKDTLEDIKKRYDINNLVLEDDLDGTPIYSRDMLWGIREVVRYLEVLYEAQLQVNSQNEQPNVINSLTREY